MTQNEKITRAENDHLRSLVTPAPPLPLERFLEEQRAIDRKAEFAAFLVRVGVGIAVVGGAFLAGFLIGGFVR